MVRTDVATLLQKKKGLGMDRGFMVDLAGRILLCPCLKPYCMGFTLQEPGTSLLHVQWCRQAHGHSALQCNADQLLRSASLLRTGVMAHRHSRWCLQGHVLAAA